MAILMCRFCGKNFNQRGSFPRSQLNADLFRNSPSISLDPSEPICLGANLSLEIGRQITRLERFYVSMEIKSFQVHVAVSSLPGHKKLV
jgi:hypothetical protein